MPLRAEHLTPLAEASLSLAYKPDWPVAMDAWKAWWRGESLALSVTAPADEPWERIDKPDPANKSLEFMWWDPDFWTQSGLHSISKTFFGGTAVPILPTWISGPVCLGTLLGGEGKIQNGTIWLEPMLTEPDADIPLAIDRESLWWRRHEAILTRAVQCAQGRALPSFPDVEGAADALCGLRGDDFLMDLILRPDWVQRRLAEACDGFAEMVEAFWPILRDPWGGSSIGIFGIWAPGRTVKLQCDMSCMISPAMFDEFVLPTLDAHAAVLDYVYYHLDGTTALQHLPSLLTCEAIDAIEWTPQAGLPQGGDPQWYDLYRQIKAAGKSVHAFGVEPEDVLPLIDAVGAEGLCITAHTKTQQEACALLQSAGWPE